MTLKQTLIDQINTQYPDNTTALITPEILRTQSIDEVNSWQQAPQVQLLEGHDTYTVSAVDYGQLVTLSHPSFVAVTIPSAGNPGFTKFNVAFRNNGAGFAVITPTSGSIEGNSSFQLNQGQAVWLVSDSVGNWRVSNFDNAGVFGLKPWADVRRYGARADGTGDDGQAFNDARTALGTSGGTVFVPAGRYRITTPINDGGRPVRYVGAGNATSIFAAGDIDVFTLSGRFSSIDQMHIEGPNGVGVTHDAVVINGVDERIENSEVVFGNHCIRCVGPDYVLEDTTVAGAYGSALIYTGGPSAACNGFQRRVKSDAGLFLDASSIPPAPGPTYPYATRTAGNSYTYGQVVLFPVAGWYVQCRTAGTVSGAEPSLVGRKLPGSGAPDSEIAINDGTAVFILAAPVDYYGLEINGGSYSVFTTDGDFTGFFTAGIIMRNTNGAVAMGSVVISEATFGMQWNSCIICQNGNDVRINNSQFGGGAGTFQSPGGAGVDFKNSFMGDASVIDNTMFYCPVGVLIEGNIPAPNQPRNYRVIGNLIVAATSVGVYVGPHVTDFTISNNTIGESLAWSGPTIPFGILIDGNAASLPGLPAANDRYTIIGNTFNNVTTAVSDGGGFTITGSQKIINYPARSYTGVFDAKNGFRVNGAAPLGQVLVGDGTNFVPGSSSGTGVRTVLTANKDYYVNPVSGLDTNDGSSGAKFQHVQHALDEAAKLDTSIYDVLIHLDNGTYVPDPASSDPNNVVSCRKIFGSGTVHVIGNTASPGSVIFSNTAVGGGAINANESGQYWVRGFTTSTPSGFAVSAQGANSSLLISDFVIGTHSSNYAQIAASLQGKIYSFTNYQISSGGFWHLFASFDGIIQFSNAGTGAKTCTLGTNLQFGTLGLVSPLTSPSGGFAHVDNGGIILARPSDISWVGGTNTVAGGGFEASDRAKGRRYAVESHGIIDTAGAGLTFLPGGGLPTQFPDHLGDTAASSPYGLYK